MTNIYTLEQVSIIKTIAITSRRSCEELDKTLDDIVIFILHFNIGYFLAAIILHFNMRLYIPSFLWFLPMKIQQVSSLIIFFVMSRIEHTFAPFLVETAGLVALRLPLFNSSNQELSTHVRTIFPSSQALRLG